MFSSISSEYTGSMEYYLISKMGILEEEEFQEHPI